LKNKKTKRISRTKSQHTFAGWEKLDGKSFHKLWHDARQSFYEESPTKELIALVFDWMKKTGYSSIDISTAKKSIGYPGISSSTGLLCKLLKAGCPDHNPIHAEYMDSLPGTRALQPLSSYIKTAIEHSITNGSLIEDEIEQKEEKPKAEVISIQQRMLEQVIPLMSEFEEILDNLDINKFDPYKMLLSSEIVKPAHAKIIKDQYASMLEEAKEVVAFEDEQIKEAYNHLSKNERKHFLMFYEKIDVACDMIINAGKAKRKPRKAKAVSKEKIISRLNYQTTNTEFKVVSINPIDILGATELWVFNTKYRRIGKYVADSLFGELSVKGSTIINYDPTKSIQKTLRKPEEQLKQFNKSGKVALRKYLDEITSKPALLNGRINKDTILLKII